MVGTSYLGPHTPALCLKSAVETSMPAGIVWLRRPRAIEMKLTLTTHEEQAREDRSYWRSHTYEERLDEVEKTAA